MNIQKNITGHQPGIRDQNQTANEQMNDNFQE